MTCLISYVNWVDRPGAGIAASPGPSTLPAANLADPVVQRRFRASGTDCWVLVDFGAPREVGVLALAQPHDAGGLDPMGEPLGHLDAADTVRHRLDLAAAGEGAALDTGTVPCRVARGYGLHVHVLAGPVTARYWRLDLSAPSLGVPGFVDLGRVWAGPALRPANNFAFGWRDLWADATAATTVSRSGLRVRDLRHRQRRLDLAFPALTAAEARGAFKELSRTVGLRGQVLVSPDPGGVHEPTEAILGDLAECTPIDHPDAAGFSKAFSIIQSL